MSELKLRQRTRLAMGHKPAKYAQGGMVVPGGGGLKERQLSQTMGGVRQPTIRVKTSANPLVKAKRNNKIPGM